MGKMVFDLDPDKCTACYACVLACMDQNDIDCRAGQHPFRNAAELELKISGGTRFACLSLACMHCEDAPCIMACPAGCLYRDMEWGLTLYDNTGCIGCHSCDMACPFGALSFGADGRMVKCDGCIERLKRGMIPACVRVCPSGALTCRPAGQVERENKMHSLQSVARKIVQGD